jgi:hypothetical protein
MSNSKYGVAGRDLFAKQYPGPSNMTDEEACKMFGHRPMQPSFAKSFCKTCFADMEQVKGKWRLCKKGVAA